MHGWNLCRWWS